MRRLLFQLLFLVLLAIDEFMKCCVIDSNCTVYSSLHYLQACCSIFALMHFVKARRDTTKIAPVRLAPAARLSLNKQTN